jgi:hypothetical protein
MLQAFEQSCQLRKQARVESLSLRRVPLHSRGSNRPVSQSPVFEFGGRSSGADVELLSRMIWTVCVGVLLRAVIKTDASGS